MAKREAKIGIVILSCLTPLIMYGASKSLYGQGVKEIRVRERKVIGTFKIGPEPHSLGFKIHKIGRAKVAIGPRLEFVTPDRKFLWIDDVKGRLVLMTMDGKVMKEVKSLGGKWGAAPWSLNSWIDADGSFYFWDKEVSQIMKVTTKGDVKEINMDWSKAAEIAGERIKRDAYAFRPSCWIDASGFIYVWVKTSVIFRGDDVAGGTGMLLKFDPSGRALSVLIRDKENIDFVDREGQVYITKCLTGMVVVSVYDRFGKLKESFTIKHSLPGQSSFGIQGKYFVLKVFASTEDIYGIQLLYDRATKELKAKGHGVMRLLGVSPRGPRKWHNWTIDYFNDHLIYLWSVDKDKAVLESITLEF